MDNFVTETDYKLLTNDKYTFFVLGRIIKGTVEILLTNHKNLIICFSEAPYPVWVWTPDNISDDDMEYAYQQVLSHGLLDGKNTFNMKYDLANYFIKRAATDNKKLNIKLNMYAYDCTKLSDSVTPTDGIIHKCNNNDVEDLTNFLYMFHQETEQDIKEIDECRTDAIKNIESESMYFWQDANGNNVACCKLNPNGVLAAINDVFTHPEFRRKHYAENLVYRVTKHAMDMGYIPMLYTDANYIASNACYEKIGYILRGKLCTIG